MFQILASWLQVRVADPTFLGYFIDKGVSAAAKVVRKVINLIVYFTYGRRLIVLIFSD